jgi:hypothetical protein
MKPGRKNRHPTTRPRLNVSKPVQRLKLDITLRLGTASIDSGDYGCVQVVSLGYPGLPRPDQHYDIAISNPCYNPGYTNPLLGVDMASTPAKQSTIRPRTALILEPLAYSNSVSMSRTLAKVDKHGRALGGKEI